MGFTASQKQLACLVNNVHSVKAKLDGLVISSSPDPDQLVLLESEILRKLAICGIVTSSLSRQWWQALGLHQVKKKVNVCKSRVLERDSWLEQLRQMRIPAPVSQRLENGLDFSFYCHLQLQRKFSYWKDVDFLTEQKADFGKVPILKEESCVHISQLPKRVSPGRRPIFGEVWFALTHQLNFITWATLKYLGYRIDHCSVRGYDLLSMLPKSPQPPQLLKILSGYLRLMPNLRQLDLSNVQPDLKKSPNKIHMNNVLASCSNLPDLPNLNILRIDTSNYWSSELTMKILQKYGPQLKGISIRSFDPRRKQVDKPEGKIFCVNLSVLQFHSYVFKGNSCMPWLGIFAGSPVTRIRVTIEERQGKKSKRVISFKHLLQAISKAFGSTLEQMRLDLISLDNQSPVVRYRKRREEWIAGLDFPKLRVLDITGFPGGWAFLLQMPALVSLSLSNLAWNEKEYFPGKRNILGLSWNADKMYGAAVWRLLPCLDHVLLKRQRWSVPSAVMVEDANNFSYITRKQAMAFRRMARASIYDYTSDSITPEKLEDEEDVEKQEKVIKIDSNDEEPGILKCIGFCHLNNRWPNKL